MLEGKGECLLRKIFITQWVMGWEAYNQDLNCFVDSAATTLLILAAVAVSEGLAQKKRRVFFFFQKWNFDLKGEVS